MSIMRRKRCDNCKQVVAHYSPLEGGGVKVVLPDGQRLEVRGAILFACAACGGGVEIWERAEGRRMQVGKGLDKPQ